MQPHESRSGVCESRRVERESRSEARESRSEARESRSRARESRPQEPESRRPGRRVPVLALHGTFGTAQSFAPVEGLRLIAHDQRGHGAASQRGPFDREAFVADAAAQIRAAGVGPCVVLGHSMGGLTAYQLAARQPELVSALVVVDEGAVVPPSILDVTGWPVHLGSRALWQEFFVDSPAPEYFLRSVVRDEHGWRLAFDYADMMAVQRHCVGDWWDDWLGSTCPALLLRAEHSMLLTGEHAAEMAARRPNTELVEFAGCGHWLHEQQPRAFADTVLSFLDRHGLSR
ncbi:alpha/beta hydrolase [Kutzneria viridogrisea]|uniref:Pimeloyl-ACP methyl ester carboxylesterase n=1 Tax=Kutzneria viridogrisea TaxID=47990 RepID=A0ABR6BBX7_9PSEU|nr:pimeloyl-ACP methyl ester carboxylesterase [Kutzneria viridogrisea]